MKSCRLPNLVVVAASLLNASAMAGGSAPTPAASAPMTGIVFDATGLAMGPYYPSLNAQDSDVLLSVGGQPVIVPLGLAAKADPTGMVPQGNGQVVFYETVDCSGQGWIFAPPRIPGTAAAVIVATSATNATLFLASTKLSRDAKNFRSQFFKVGQCVATSTSTRAYPVELVVDLATLYSAPYHVQ